MIPQAYLSEWRQHAPWPSESQVEQDLVISRALVEIFSDEELATKLAFRGGTALHKLFFTPASRYSEDIDLVQLKGEPIGPLVSKLRGRLDSWLGEPKRDFADGTVTLLYRFQSETPPSVTMRLKIEINSREHFSVFPLERHDYGVYSRWFEAKAKITTFKLEELLGTKLRALYQRRKGRDLFDLYQALMRDSIAWSEVITCFQHYIAHQGVNISRAQFEENLLSKRADGRFMGDMVKLIAAGLKYDPTIAVDEVLSKIIPSIPGDSWKRKPD